MCAFTQNKFTSLKEDVLHQTYMLRCDFFICISFIFLLKSLNNITKNRKKTKLETYDEYIKNFQ